MVAVAVAITALVLGSGASAAITGGRSVNPLDGIQQVVAELTGGRTEEQLAAYNEAKQHIAEAKSYARADEVAKAREELDKITPLLARLTDDDQKVIKKALSQLEKSLPG
jgi:hypothetical protein